MAFQTQLLGLLELEQRIAEGKATLNESKPILWEAICYAIGNDSIFLDRWWKLPLADLSEDRLSELETAGVLPPGILSAAAWSADLTD